MFLYYKEGININEHKEKLRKYSNNVIQQLIIMKKDGLTIEIISSTTKIPVSTVYYLIKKGCQIV